MLSTFIAKWGVIRLPPFMMEDAVVMSWIGVIVGEFLVSRAGLGYLIVYGGQVFRMDLVMGSTAVLCVCAALMYLLVAAMEKRLNRARAHGG